MDADTGARRLAILSMAAAGQAPTLREAARLHRCSPATVAGDLRALRDAGLVTWPNHSARRPARVLCLTLAGRSYLATHVKADDMLPGVRSAADLYRLCEALARQHGMAVADVIALPFTDLLSLYVPTLAAELAQLVATPPDDTACDEQPGE